MIVVLTNYLIMLHTTQQTAKRTHHFLYGHMILIVVSSDFAGGSQHSYHNLSNDRQLRYHQQQQQQQPYQQQQQPNTVDHYSNPGLPQAATSANFQRNNSVYWTLQLKNRQPPGVATAAIKSPVNIEDLYSTPNKLTKTPRTVGTPASGFSTFFRSSSHMQTPQNDLSAGAANVSASGVPPPISPINPRNIMNASESSLLTSTPTGSLGRMGNQSLMSVGKPSLSEELRNKLRVQNVEGVRSHGNSPSSSGRSTPRELREPPHQQARGRHSWANDSVEIPQTCSDRLGTPKTSLMDFKKLLLSKTAGRAPKTSSAVEQLMLKKPGSTTAAALLVKRPEEIAKPGFGQNKSAANLSSLTIQDLSGSPKTFANRRMLRGGLVANYSSPTRGGLLSAAKGGSAADRGAVSALKAAKHDIMSTSIPEVNNEEDSFGSPTQLLPHQPTSDELLSPTSPPSPAPSSATGIVTDRVNLRENFFLKTEENNFPRHEIQSQKQHGLLNVYGSGGRKPVMHQQRPPPLLGNSKTTNNNCHFVPNRNLAKVNSGNTLTSIAENQAPVGSRGNSPPLPPSLETSL